MGLSSLVTSDFLGENMGWLFLPPSHTVALFCAQASWCRTIVFAYFVAPVQFMMSPGERLFWHWIAGWRSWRCIQRRMLWRCWWATKLMRLVVGPLACLAESQKVRTILILYCLGQWLPLSVLWTPSTPNHLCCHPGLLKSKLSRGPNVEVNVLDHHVDRGLHLMATWLFQTKFHPIVLPSIYLSFHSQGIAEVPDSSQKPHLIP